MSQIACNFSATFPNFLHNFCHKFSATFGYFSATFWGDYIILLAEMKMEDYNVIQHIVGTGSAMVCDEMLEMKRGIERFHSN